MDHLLVQAQSDPAAFGSVYEQTIAHVFRYCMVLTRGDEDQSWDLCSEVYMKALLRIRDYEDQGYLYTSYLCRIARNIFIDELRKQRTKEHYLAFQEKEFLHELQEDMPDSLLREEEEAFETRMKLHAIHGLIQQLPPGEQELLYLRYEQQMKYEEIAKHIQSHTNTVKVRFHRLYKKLHQEYFHLYPSPTHTL